MGVRLQSLTKTHDGLLYKEYKGETEFHYIVIRDVLTEIQMGMGEREFEAIQNTKVVGQKKTAQFWEIEYLCETVGLEMPENYMEF